MQQRLHLLQYHINSQDKHGHKHGDCPPVQRPTSATPRHFPPHATSTAPHHGNAPPSARAPRAAVPFAFRFAKQTRGLNKHGDCPPLQRHASATPRHFPPPATSTAPIEPILRPPPALLAAVPFAFRSSLCLFRYPPSSGRRCVQFSLLYIAMLRRAARSFPSADPASPFARLCDYRLSPIKRLATFSRTRFMHRKIRRQTHYRLQCKFNRSDKCTFKNLQLYPYRL